MNTQGARYLNRHAAPRRAPIEPRFLAAPTPPPVHDLLVMSHGPGTPPDAQANHACLNTFTSSSWIIAVGG